MENQSAISLSARHSKEVRRLADVSHKMPMDLLTSLPWDLGVDRSKAPKIESASWIYGTSHWDRLNEEQRHALLWEENARDVSMFIWLEQTLPPLYMGYVNRYSTSLAPEVLEYLMIFSKEEIVHTLAFRRYMAMANLKAFRPPQGLHELFVVRLPQMPPVIGILCTLLVEYIAELSAMHASQHECVDPLTRALFKRHHQDELRHIAFGRYVGESFFAKASGEEAAKARELVGKVAQQAIMQFTYNPEIVERLPIASDGVEAIDAIRNSKANLELNRVRFAELYQWLRSLEIPL